VAAVAWYFIDTARWQAAFDNLIVPCLGILFLPWTVLAYVLVGAHGIGGLEWALLIVAFLIDIGSLSGGAYQNRERLRQYR
jgi:hypothetical protein